MITFDRLREIISNTDLDFREYSGRGMFGDNCPAVSCEDTADALADLVEACANTEEAAELVRRHSTDSLGRGVVIYWPGIKKTEWGL